MIEKNNENTYGGIDEPHKSNDRIYFYSSLFYANIILKNEYELKLQKICNHF